MSLDKKSRAFDPTYKPTKSWEDLAAQNPGNPGLQMLASRARSQQVAASGPQADP